MIEAPDVETDPVNNEANAPLASMVRLAQLLLKKTRSGRVRWDQVPTTGDFVAVLPSGEVRVGTEPDGSHSLEVNSPGPEWDPVYGVWGNEHPEFEDLLSQLHHWVARRGGVIPTLDNILEDVEAL